MHLYHRLESVLHYHYLPTLLWLPSIFLFSLCICLCLTGFGAACALDCLSLSVSSSFFSLFLCSSKFDWRTIVDVFIFAFFNHVQSLMVNSFCYLSDGWSYCFSSMNCCHVVIVVVIIVIVIIYHHLLHCTSESFLNLFVVII